MATDSPTPATEPERAKPGKHLGGPRELYRELWRLSAGKRGAFLLALTLLVAGISVKLSLPYLAAQAINRLLKNHYT
jgi:hypothetical protein